MNQKKPYEISANSITLEGGVLCNDTGRELTRYKVALWKEILLDSKLSMSKQRDLVRGGVHQQCDGLYEQKCHQ